MTSGIPELSVSRLEARIPTHVYELMQRAAQLRGLSLTADLIATAGEEARRTVEDAEVIRLSREDQVRFVEALIDPPSPNERLIHAAKRHAELVTRR